MERLGSRLILLLLLRGRGLGATLARHHVRQIHRVDAHLAQLGIDLLVGGHVFIVTAVPHGLRHPGGRPGSRRRPHHGGVHPHAAQRGDQVRFRRHVLRVDAHRAQLGANRGVRRVGRHLGARAARRTTALLRLRLRRVLHGLLDVEPVAGGRDRHVVQEVVQLRRQHLAAAGHVHRLLGLARRAAQRLQHPQRPHALALHRLAEHGVLSVEVRLRPEQDEKLRAVGVGPRVGHRQDAARVVLERKVLVVKDLAVDGLAAGAVAHGDVAALRHEPGDDAVQRRPPVRQRVPARLLRRHALHAVLAAADLDEVEHRAGRRLAVQPKQDGAQRAVLRGQVQVRVVGEGGVGGVPLDERLPALVPDLLLLQRHHHHAPALPVGLDAPEAAVRVHHGLLGFLVEEARQRRLAPHRQAEPLGVHLQRDVAPAHLLRDGQLDQHLVRALRPCGLEAGRRLERRPRHHHSPRRGPTRGAPPATAQGTGRRQGVQ
mmetsp:Transcript_46994/g.119884  ORF Transcript_46994/g.119884 Transcript_46994/m.119884 type:complete len:487 (+) Transcript_46994:375-1835(+)